MSKNALLKLKKEDRQRRKRNKAKRPYRQLLKLYKAMKAYHSDSFLLDSDRLSFGQFDHYDEATYDQYLNAQQIYDEFVKIDSDLKRQSSYKLGHMLDIMEILLGNRYQSFHHIYKKQYRIKPISKNRYLAKAQKDLEKVLYKYEMNIAIDKWSDREKDKVIGAVVLLANYYRSTGRFDLADTIRHEPITKPKTFAEIAKGWREFYTPKMAKACKITKKEANKQLQEVIKKIKSDF